MSRRVPGYAGIDNPDLVIRTSYADQVAQYFQPGLIIIGYTVADRDDGGICSKGKLVDKVGKPRTGQQVLGSCACIFAEAIPDISVLNGVQAEYCCYVLIVYSRIITQQFFRSE